MSDKIQNTGPLQPSAWQGYLKNLGDWVGQRALADCRGKVLIDLPTRVSVERYRTPDDEDFLLWRTSIRTADGIDELDEEWSVSELAELGALAADGSFSVGADVFCGEQITVDNCIFEDEFRVRTTHAFDWEGFLAGVVVSRERIQRNESTGTNSRQAAALAFVEPAAWRSPGVLFDYMVGVWEGRGISIEVSTGITYQLSSRLKLHQRADGTVEINSVLQIDQMGPSRIFEATGKMDRNILVYMEAGVQVVLLPGGACISSPTRIRKGRPFSIESAFLTRPDCRKRVIRLYDRDCEWISTVFINERRVG